MGANVDCEEGDDQPSNAARGETVSVNGLEMYYESRGVGRPLVLLHGAMSTIETSFGAVIPLLAETRRLIAIEQQGPSPHAGRQTPPELCANGPGHSPACPEAQY
jgi:pimeloyl-ACP methyl ester carboxylesterase